MYKLIPSKDVRDYMEKKGRRLTDFEKATLIYNHSEMNYEEKTEALIELVSVTVDTELKGQIRERLVHDRRCIKRFFEKREDEIYEMKVFISEDQEWSESNSYISGEIAVACGRKFHEKFSVHKIRILNEEQKLDDCCAERPASFHFNSEGVLQDYYSSEIVWIGEKGEDNKGRFENRFIDILHPFRTGDFVRVKYHEYLGDEICIVEGYRDDEEYEKKRIKYEDIKNGIFPYGYGDVSMRVAYEYGDARFGHEHVRIVDVEYAELDEKHPKKKLLLNASLLIRGHGGLSDFQVACDEYRRQREYRKL